MKTTRLTAFAVLFLGTAGCQCCSWTEHSQDTIDHIADHQPHLDRFYHPEWDLTRIGYPDWCQSSFNRWLYGDCCCRDTRQPPAYLHNPMFSPESRAGRTGPIPEESPLPPRDDAGPDSQENLSTPAELKGIPDSRELDKGDRLPPLPPIAPPPSSPSPFPEGPSLPAQPAPPEASANP